MKKLELNFEIKNLDGAPIGDAGQVLANLLMGETKGDAVKYFDWAMSLNKKEPINLDDSDFTKIKDLLRDTDKLTILAKAQIIKYFETIK